MNGLIKKDFYLIMKEIPVLFFVIVGAGGALANLSVDFYYRGSSDF